MSLLAIIVLSHTMGLAFGQTETDFVLAKAIVAGDGGTIRAILQKDPESGSRHIYRDLTAIQFACSPDAPPTSFVSVIQSVGTSQFLQQGVKGFPIESLYELGHTCFSDQEADRRQVEKIVYLGKHAPSLLFARENKRGHSISGYWTPQVELLLSVHVLSYNWPRTIHALSNCGALPADAVLYADSPQAISILTASGFTMNARDLDGNTALHLRLADGSGGEAIEALLRNGLQPTALNNAGETALMFGIKKFGLRQDVVRVLRSKRAGVDIPDYAGRTAMHTAAEVFAPAVIRLLHSLSFSARARDKEGVTPLHLLSRDYFLGVPPSVAQECIAALIEAGADVNARDAAGQTPLMEMLQNDQAAPESWTLVDYLISRGADLRARDTFGRSVLHLVRPEWDVPERAGQVIVRLLELGADVRAVDADGNTVLHRIVLDGLFHNYYDAQVRAIRELRARGAGVDTVNGLGRTPLDDAIALYGKGSEVARALIGG